MNELGAFVLPWSKRDFAGQPDSRTEQPLSSPSHCGGTGRGAVVLVANGKADRWDASTPRLPSAQTLRSIVRKRRLRARFFDAELFADPAWDILLDLAAARVEGRRVSVSSLCIAAAVPATTALRWISLMVASGVLVREPDVADRRRIFIALSDDAATTLASYFAVLERDGVVLV